MGNASLSGVAADLGISTTSAAAPAESKFKTIANFTGPHGSFPLGGLLIDAAGDLFGVAGGGGAHGDGAVFEIARTASRYVRPAITLVSFNGADGVQPLGGLFADAAGDLFGVTGEGGTDNDGTVFEIAKTESGYAGAPTTLVSFAGANGERPDCGLIADAAGDLFGTTQFGGAHGDGTVFEIAKTENGYASAPTTLVSFTGPDGRLPVCTLTADAAGNLFGATLYGGADDDGTIFEVAKTAGGYAGAPTTLVSFTGADGKDLSGGLIADAAGDLFGTSEQGGPEGDGTVFEIVKTSGGYASAPTTLVSFAGADGSFPEATLIADAAGDLFGTTYLGGTAGDGTAFEIVKTASGYANAPTVLESFTGANGDQPQGSLVADVKGNLFGTTSAGGPVPGDHGTAFKITHAGFVAPAATAAPLAAAIRPAPSAAAFARAIATHPSESFGSAHPPTPSGARIEMAMLLSRPQLA